MCRSTEKLTVHHIDGNGRDSGNPTNTINNLLTLCRSCHAKVHYNERYEAKKRNGFKVTRSGKWSRKHTECISCGSMQIKHRAFGLCMTCYEKNKRNTKTKI